MTQHIHDSEIIKQFTKQAIPFTELSAHSDSIQTLIELSGVNDKSEVLDVACGPGLVACAFAKIAHSVTGIDITEKMIEQAIKQQKEQNLTNISWNVGTVLSLPYASNSFSVVITRYSFHHFLNPKVVLAEMIRVCKPNGVVLIADVSLPSNKIDAYNHMEKLRDPSHVKALSCEKWEKLMNESGLKNLRRGSYKLEMELEKQLSASFPKEGDKQRLKEIFKRDINVNSLGVDAHYLDNEIHFTYPIDVYVGYNM